MSEAEKIIVVQFKNSRGGVVPGEMRQASNQASAEKIASAMAPRHIGVAAYAVTVDEESGGKSADDKAIALALNRSLWREGQGRVRPGLPAWRFLEPHSPVETGAPAQDQQIILRYA